ncbi:hypothetical protein MHB40_03120 [Lysinibacillus sp. FSL K6-0057]|uniref:hypothetical protein n=1 Tax=Lysinibacillus sp. FSL K6-0057 TaxID=2921411 RepID=UPI00315AC0CB
MLYEKVKQAAERARKKNPGANDFYIPIEDFIEFVTFHLIATIKMRNTMSSTKMSMSQYLQQDETYLNLYKKKVKDEEEEYREFHNTLRNAINRYNTLNHKTAIEADKRKSNEAKAGSRGTRFENTITIHDFQAKSEMPMLMDVKETKGPLNTVYQRILKNNSHNINFTNYKLFTEYLNEEIQKQELTDDEKYLHQYMIEKNLKLHALKEICKCYEEILEATSHLSQEQFVVNDRQARLQLMLYATNMPMLQQWQPYIKVVNDLPFYNFDLFIQEIDSVTNFIKCILLEYCNEHEDIVFDESDMEHFRKYIDPKRFQNDYGVRKGFSSSTFNIVMEEIKRGNEQATESSF